MFGLGDFLKNMGAVAKLAHDENFKRLMGHPKIQQLLANREFVDAARSKNFMKLLSNPEFAALMSDPEVMDIMTRIDKDAVK